MKKTLLLCSFAALIVEFTSSEAFEVHAQQKLEAPRAAPAPANCRVEPVNYKGWQAQQVSNAWITLIFVPQIGGRLMQVTFDGHPYLFVNEHYAGKQLPP